MLQAIDFPLAEINIFGQLLEWPDLVIVGLLVLLEGLLSIDNALVLGLLAKRLPKDMRARALSYGLIGAFVFRILAIALAAFLLQWTIVKLVGGGYLIFIAVKHLFFTTSDDDDNRVILDEAGHPVLVHATTGDAINDLQVYYEIEQRVPVGASIASYDGSNRKAKSTDAVGANCDVLRGAHSAFWRTVLVIELTDIAFAVDSILAAIALAGSRKDKIWVVIVGGILGVILMRFAAAIFIKLLERFPKFELSAYLLVIIIGLKLVLDWGCNSDWSFRNSPLIGRNLGTWRASFENFEDGRRKSVENYENWLKTSWPLGMAESHHEVLKPADETTAVQNENPDVPSKVGDEKLKLPDQVPQILDFHDLRRPESITFWSLMAICFAVGFLPAKKRRLEPATKI